MIAFSIIAVFTCFCFCQNHVSNRVVPVKEFKDVLSGSCKTLEFKIVNETGVPLDPGVVPFLFKIMLCYSIDTYSNINKYTKPSLRYRLHRYEIIGQNANIGCNVKVANGYVYNISITSDNNDKNMRSAIALKQILKSWKSMKYLEPLIVGSKKSSVTENSE